ncbi:MAG: hypothetical protein SGPRY_008691 [Prymnesium sp.]
MRLPRSLWLALGVLLLLDLSLHLRQTLSALSLAPRRPHAARLAAPSGPHHLLSLARSVADPSSALVLLFARAEQSELLNNFLALASHAGAAHMLLAIAIDDDAHTLVRSHGVACHRAQPSELSDLFPPPSLPVPPEGGEASHSLASQLYERSASHTSRLYATRWQYLAALGQAGMSVWLSDPRVLWIQPPSAAQIASSCDLAIASAGVGGLTPALSFHRASEGVGRWQLRMAAALGRGEGSEASLLRQSLERCEEGGECVRWCELQAELFPNGIQYFRHRKPHIAKATGRVVAILADAIPPELLRYNLRENALWKLPPPGPAEGERFLAFKELVIDNGLSNTRGALRSALAIAELTNRTLVLPPLYSRHLHGEPFRVGADYYFDLPRLQRAFPNLREATALEALFPGASEWPPRPPTRVFFLQLSQGEALCAESVDSSLMERRGKDNATCPPLHIQPSRLHTRLASGFHLGETDSQLLEWLAPFSSQRLIFFGRMFRRFWRFESPTMQADFNRRLEWGVRPAPEIRAAAASTLRAVRAAAGGWGGFDCVHMRRRDFLADHQGEEVSVGEYARRAASKLRAQAGGARSLPLYLASDVAEQPGVRRSFEQHFPRVITLLDSFPRDDLDVFGSMPLSSLPETERHAALARDMRFGNVDQLVCSQADRFVGNKWSSFTHHVCHLREQRSADACRDADIYGRRIDSRMEYV